MQVPRTMRSKFWQVRSRSGSTMATRKVLSLVGVGSCGHVISAVAGAHPDYEVRLLTRRPEVFEDKKMTVQRPGLMGGDDVVGKIDIVGTEPEEVLPGSDVVLWCGPVVNTRSVLERMAPTIQQMRRDSQDVAVGTVFSQGCVHLLAQQVLGRDVPFFALQNVPWLCTTNEPGKVATIVT